MEQLLTIDDLASAWQVPKSWIYEQTRFQRIPHRRVGKYIRFVKDEVEAWLTDSPGSLKTKSIAKTQVIERKFYGMHT